MNVFKQKIPALNRIEARHMWEVAFWIGHGYHMKFDYDSNRIFMIRGV